MDTHFIPRISEKIQSSLLNGFKLGVMNGNPENFQNPDKIEAFKSIIENCCKIEQELKDELAIIQNFQCESIEEFDREFAKVLKNSKHDLPSAKTADRYQKFVKDLEDIQFVSDTQANASIAEAAVQVDDMQIEEENIRIDPITKNPIQKPVVNKNCNHIYDCTSITEAIRLNPRIKCPYMGCSNKKAVTLNDIVENRDLTRKYLQEENQMEAMPIDSD